MAQRNQAPNMDVFDSYFRRADLDQDGRISGNEAVAFFQGSNLPNHILAQIWMHADQNRTGFLGRTEFYNALKLVTVAQSGRELTPDMVKAALFGPAASKIPAPQINPVAAPAPQLNSTAPAPAQMNVVAPTSSQSLGFRGPQTLPNASVSQQFFSSPANQFMRPPQLTPAVSSLPVQGVGQGLPGGGSVAGPRAPNISTDWLVGRPPGGTSVGINSQVSSRGITPPPLGQDGGFGIAPSGITPSGPPALSGLTPSSSAKPQEATVFPSFQQEVKESKPSVVSGNGFSSDSIFGGDVFSVTPPQPKPDASAPTISASSMPNPATNFTIATGPQPSVKQGQLDPLQRTLNTLPDNGQLQQVPTHVKQNQVGAVQSTPLVASNFSISAIGSTSGQSQLPWPKITQSNIQKYTAVFVKVDTDRDGKITGEQARNLFLSWRLPREVLKQVWDLSDQDGDSMLSLREFCTALYLMERYREGSPLPAVLPSSARFDEALLPATGQPAMPYGSAAWQPTPGMPQQGASEARSLPPGTGLKPWDQVLTPPQTDASVQPVQQKSRVPVLEKHLVNQLSKEEQSSLNSKFQDATEADKKVEELEKVILDSKEKIEFYRTKMQELVLYKSRCDNRLNEITERASADKREAESLAKKYEEKYKQAGDVASKLTAEEATFRDIQAKKLELYSAIVKMEQGGNADGVLKDRADKIQSDLEELVKALNERCKGYGLRVKPTTLIELPFGWQPGVQEGAADWDEDWDKFEDEGFIVVKELTVEVENVVVSAKPKAASVTTDKPSVDEGPALESSSDVDPKMEKPNSTGERTTESGSTSAQSEDVSARSPPGSPPGRNAVESPSKKFPPSQFEQNASADASPRVKENQSDHSGAESALSGDKPVDKPSWGATFDDANDDIDSVWGFNTKETDHERNGQNSFFGSGDLGLNPIRTESPHADSLFGKKEKGPFSFADSVPGTPLFNSVSPPRYSEGSEDHSFDSFPAFDSFSVHDNGLFPPRENLARFDSMRSTRDSEPSGLFPPHENLARFDSIRSTRDSETSRGFPFFDDSDPFGSTGPFKSSESQTPRQNSYNWSAF